MPPINLKWSMRRLVKSICSRLLNKFDVFIVVEGKRGLGKSTLAYKLLLLVKKEMKRLGIDGYKFIPRRDLLYQRKEVLKFFHSTNRSGIADEMINVTFNRDFYNEEQKDLIKMINMNRDHNNLFISCVPQFKNLDSQIKNLCSMKITVVRRGLAIVHLPNKVVYSADIWDEKFNEKIERQWLKGGVTNPRYSRLTTFKGFLKFPKLTEKQELSYQKIKDEKRNIIAKEKGLEEVDEQEPFQIIYNALIDGKIKNTAMVEGMALAHGLNIEGTKAKLRRELNANSKPTKLAVYYFDSKEKEKEVQEERKRSEVTALIDKIKSSTLNSNTI